MKQGDVFFNVQGKMRIAIQHYESALFKEIHVDTPMYNNQE
jgi:hypothetical protein